MNVLNYPSTNIQIEFHKAPKDRSKYLALFVTNLLHFLCSLINSIYNIFIFGKTINTIFGE